MVESSHSFIDIECNNNHEQNNSVATTPSAIPLLLDKHDFKTAETGPNSEVQIETESESDAKIQTKTSSVTSKSSSIDTSSSSCYSPDLQIDNLSNAETHCVDNTSSPNPVAGGKFNTAYLRKHNIIPQQFHCLQRKSQQVRNPPYWQRNIHESDRLRQEQDEILQRIMERRAETSFHSSLQQQQKQQQQTLTTKKNKQSNHLNNGNNNPYRVKKPCQTSNNWHFDDQPIEDRGVCFPSSHLHLSHSNTNTIPAYLDTHDYPVTMSISNQNSTFRSLTTSIDDTSHSAPATFMKTTPHISSKYIFQGKDSDESTVKYIIPTGDLFIQEQAEILAQIQMKNAKKCPSNKDKKELIRSTELSDPKPLDNQETFLLNSNDSTLSPPAQQILQQNITAHDQMLDYSYHSHDTSATLYSKVTEQMIQQQHDILREIQMTRNLHEQKNEINKSQNHPIWQSSKYCLSPNCSHNIVPSCIPAVSPICPKNSDNETDLAFLKFGRRRSDPFPHVDGCDIYTDYIPTNHQSLRLLHNSSFEKRKKVMSYSYDDYDKICQNLGSCSLHGAYVNHGTSVEKKTNCKLFRSLPSSPTHKNGYNESFAHPIDDEAPSNLSLIGHQRNISSTFCHPQYTNYDKFEKDSRKYKPVKCITCQNNFYVFTGIEILHCPKCDSLSAIDYIET